METTERKLKKIIEEIGKKQLERFDEKAAKHNPGSSSDVASDDYDWNDPVIYWRSEVLHHVLKLYESKNKALETPGFDERSEILNLMNVLTALYHKLELEAELYHKLELEDGK